MQAIVTAVVLMCSAVVTGQASPPTDTGFWFAVLWLMILASLGGYVMYVYVTRTRGATVVSTLLYLTPPTTMLWVWLMFGEPITLTDVVGLLVSGPGVLLVLRVRQPSIAARQDRTAGPDEAAPEPIGEKAADNPTRRCRHGHS
jgi:drug/metabolite transporter (DMT)-like permease